MSMKADEVKIASLTATDRPGGLQAMIMPTKLKDQVVWNAGKTNLLIKVIGKNLVGGPQWGISFLRPGGDNTRPVIVSKQEQKAMGEIAAAFVRGMR